MKRALCFVFWCLLIVTPGFSQLAELPDSPWTFLDTHTIGAHQFLEDHPTYDGRGVIIYICDSGVDMGVQGLRETSEGKVKVVDAQDFSGQGDIPLHEVEIDTSGNAPLLKTDQVRLWDVESLTYQPEDSIYWIGALDEQKYFQNAGPSDINNNGTTDDVFGIVTFPVTIEEEERWVYFIDEDGNGSLSGEVARFNYHYQQDTFSFTKRALEEQKALYTFAMNIRLDEQIASFHACDNSHGTHCAGIAAGYQLFGQETQHGIAPGAQVISGKIGVGTLSGGATTTGSMYKAYEYGIEYAKEHNVPIVFSMSYGVDSEIEGRSDIERHLNSVMQENENVIVITSNGNAGPGLSSAGNPSCAERIMSIGALLPLGTARDLYGFANDGDRVFHFSSRGGECAKPDCMAPGAAASSVPKHAEGQNFWGTSMACPQVAGAAAVLISACQQEGVPWNGALIKRALVHSAAPLEGYTPLDQGSGVININRAFEIMKTFAQRNEAETVLDYHVETTCPSYPDLKGRNAYWRTGGYVPTLDKQTFTVNAMFPNEATADERSEFYRAFRLKSDQPWFKLDKSSTYIRAEQETSFGGYYQPELLQEPGLYVATISAYPKTGAGQNIPDFQILNSVIVPHHFSAENDYTLNIRGKSLDSGRHHRYFIEVPPGASGMTVELSPSGRSYCKIYGYLYNPEGHVVKRLPTIDPEKKQPVQATVYGDDLIPGTWEIIPFAFHDVPQTSIYDVQVSFEGFEIPDALKDFSYESGETPKGEFSVTSHYKHFEGSASGTISGYGRTSGKTVNGDTYSYEFQVGDDISRVSFALAMPKETWNLFTDVAVNIAQDGKYVASSGFFHRSCHIAFSPKTPGTYTLEVRAAFAEPDKASAEWPLNVEEVYHHQDPTAIQVTQNENKRLQCFPGVPHTLEFEVQSVPLVVPTEFTHWGDIVFRRESDNEVAAQLPIRFEF
mgnify:CR=1 FL=1